MDGRQTASGRGCFEYNLNMRGLAPFFSDGIAYVCNAEVQGRADERPRDVRKSSDGNGLYCCA